MKPKNVIMLLIIGVILFTTYKIIKIQSMSLSECFGNNVGAIGDIKATLAFAQNQRNDKTKNIMFISVPILLILCVTYSITRKNEIKNDPIKNLENLKLNSIISDEEFNLKKEQIDEIEISKKQIREIQKLIENLENLKSKGLLSQQEFDEKVKLINKNKQ